MEIKCQEAKGQGYAARCVGYVRSDAAGLTFHLLIILIAHSGTFGLILVMLYDGEFSVSRSLAVLLGSSVVVRSAKRFSEALIRVVRSTVKTL